MMEIQSTTSIKTKNKNPTAQELLLHRIYLKLILIMKYYYMLYLIIIQSIEQFLIVS